MGLGPWDGADVPRGVGDPGRGWDPRVGLGLMSLGVAGWDRGWGADVHGGVGDLGRGRDPVTALGLMSTGVAGMGTEGGPRPQGGRRSPGGGGCQAGGVRPVPPLRAGLLRGGAAAAGPAAGESWGGTGARGGLGGLAAVSYPPGPMGRRGGSATPLSKALYSMWGVLFTHTHTRPIGRVIHPPTTS